MWLQPLEDSEGEVGRRHLVGEALADEAGELLLMLEGVDGRDDAARAVAKNEDRERAFAGAREIDELLDVAHVVGELVDIEVLPLGATVAAEVERVDGEPSRRELLSGPLVEAAVRLEAVNQDHDALGLGRGLPRAGKILMPPSPTKYSSLIDLSSCDWVVSEPTMASGRSGAARTRQAGDTHPSARSARRRCSLGDSPSRP